MLDIVDTWRMYGLTRGELALLRSLRTPAKVQSYLDGLTYNLEAHGDTLRSPRRVMRDHTAHCAEGALFAAAAKMAPSAQCAVRSRITRRGERSVSPSGSRL